MPDYRSCSGAVRRAVQDFSLLLEKRSLLVSWDIERAEGESYLYDPGGRMIAFAAASGLVLCKIVVFLASNTRPYPRIRGGPATSR